VLEENTRHSVGEKYLSIDQFSIKDDHFFKMSVALLLLGKIKASIDISLNSTKSHDLI
jgi:hypothetical protein